MALLDRAKFDAALQELTKLHQRRECFILFSSAFSGTIELRDRDAINTLRTRGLSEDEIRSAFAEIASLVLAALRAGELDDVFYLIRGSRNPADDERAEYTARFEAVRSALVDNHLTRRYQLKRLSKAPAFSDIDWDVKLKITDALDEAFAPFPYATIKLKYQLGFEGVRGFPFLPMSDQDSVQVNFTSDELSYLITSLEHARESLERAENLKIGSGEVEAN